MKTIEIKCKGAIELDIDELHPFQGNLKDLSKENYNKLRKQILDLGFSEPMSVWKAKDGRWMILNAHQRHRVLTELRNAEGYHIPPIPCSIVEAANEHEAKRKVLSLTSQFGEITSAGLFEFASQANIDLPTLEDFRFPEIDMDKWKSEFFEDILPTELPELNSEIEAPNLEQMTFILSKEQVIQVKDALEKSKELGDFGDTGNLNSNGNALARIVEQFLNE